MVVGLMLITSGRQQQAYLDMWTRYLVLGLIHPALARPHPHQDLSSDDRRPGGAGTAQEEEEEEADPSFQVALTINDDGKLGSTLPVRELLETVRTAAIATMAALRKEFKGDWLTKLQDMAGCASTRLGGKRAQFEEEKKKTACGYCQKYSYPCIRAEHKDGGAVLLPLPEAEREGMEVSDQGYWVKGETVSTAK